MKHALSTLIAGAALAAAPAAAMGVEVCPGASVGTTSAFLCFGVEPNPGDGTVAPAISFCPLVNGSADACVAGPVAEFGATGFRPNPAAALPEVDPVAGTVRFAGGEVGTAFIDGNAVPVLVPPFCVGLQPC